MDESIGEPPETLKKRFQEFAIVWTRPNGEEVARWEFKNGDPQPEGYCGRLRSLTKELIETHYGDGEYRFHVKLDPVEIARMFRK
jgi:hypothetical protein